MKVLQIIRKEKKKLILVFLRSAVRTNLLSVKLWKRKKKKKFVLVLLSHLRLAKVVATVHGKCLVQMENALNLYSKIGWERGHIHICFIRVYCYHFSLDLLVIVNLLLCLIYKLNFIIGMYVQENTVYIVSSTIHSFRHPLGSWNVSPTDKGRL